MKTKKYALILAGGRGARLWPLSRENYPKQFVEFKDGLSLFQLSILRLLPAFLTENIFIVTQENYRFSAHNQIDLLKQLNSGAKNTLKRNIILEPDSRNTLPAVMLSVKYLEEKKGLAPDDLICAFSCDHIIEPVAKFIKALRAAQAIAARGRLVVFGVKPTHPKEGYGYVTVKGRFAEGFLVDNYIEKPPLKVAAGLIKKGALWNAGIFCFSKRSFLEELALLRPAMHRFYKLSFSELARQFREVEKISIDYGLMQSTSKGVLVKLALRYSDLGSWDSIMEYYAGKEINFNIGQAEFLHSRDCFTYSGSRLMCMVGLKDTIAIDASDSVLILKKGHSNKVRDLVSLIEKKGRGHTKDGLTVNRPWGYYKVLHEEKNYKVKELGIYPGRSLSLQKHKYRSEHWNVVKGRVHALIDGKPIVAGINESIFVPRGAKHKVFNAEKKIAKIIEVQIGSLVLEGDIERFTSVQFRGHST